MLTDDQNYSLKVFQHVTIGIPVYNEEGLIERAIRSAVGQCERLIVSDNASTDRTGEICLKLCAEFPDIEYVRHAENLGSIANWRSILDKVTSPYMMFLGSHDYLDETYVARLVDELNLNPDAVLACGNVVQHGEFTTSLAMHKVACLMADDRRARVLQSLFSQYPLHWLIYGLHRTEMLKAAYHYASQGYGGDNLIIADYLLRGKIRAVDGPAYHALMRRMDNPVATQARCNPDSDRNADRQLARIATRRKGSQIKKAYVKRLYELVCSDLPIASPVPRFLFKLKIYLHYAPFKENHLDTTYYLFYLPVKIARKLRKRHATATPCRVASD